LLEDPGADEYGFVDGVDEYGFMDEVDEYGFVDGVVALAGLVAGVVVTLIPLLGVLTALVLALE